MKSPFRSDAAGVLLLLTFAASTGVFILLAVLALETALHHLTR